MDASSGGAPAADGAPPAKKQKVQWTQVTDNEATDGRPALVAYLQKDTETKNAMSKGDAETEALNWDAIKSTHPDTGEVKWRWRKQGSKKTEISTRAVAAQLGLIFKAVAYNSEAAGQTISPAAAAAPAAATAPAAVAAPAAAAVPAAPAAPDAPASSDAPDAPAGKKQKVGDKKEKMKVTLAQDAYLQRGEKAKGKEEVEEAVKGFITLQITPPKPLPDGAVEQAYSIHVTEQPSIGAESMVFFTPGSETERLENRKTGGDPKDLIQIEDLTLSKKYKFEVRGPCQDLCPLLQPVRPQPDVLLT